jgi:hypothetical protein
VEFRLSPSPTLFYQGLKGSAKNLHLAGSKVLSYATFDLICKSRNHIVKSFHGLFALSLMATDPVDSTTKRAFVPITPFLGCEFD